jgi:hypothetical protein
LDEYGYEFRSDGDILNLDAFKFDKPETKIPLRKVVNSLGKVIQLYTTVGENEYNTEFK